ncbi:MAG: peptidylprolyl isomerase [Clostridiales bacterium]|nr:peptidylprolyl isomerase [Clostridiales bacterium]
MTDNPVIEITMENGGTIDIELDPAAAPISVANFLKLVDEEFYDGLTFHRIIDGFMIQGGDPDGTGTGGSDEEIAGEFEQNGWNNPISHKRGVISMARSNDPNSASSQFFITNTDSEFLDGGYAAFGRVLSGMDVVDEISAVDTDAGDRPLEPVVMKTIRRK